MSPTIPGYGSFSIHTHTKHDFVRLRRLHIMQNTNYRSILFEQTFVGGKLVQLGLQCPRFLHRTRNNYEYNTFGCFFKPHFKWTVNYISVRDRMMGGVGLDDDVLFENLREMEFDERLSFRPKLKVRLAFRICANAIARMQTCIFANLNVG